MARLNVESSTPTTITVGGRELVAFGGCNYLGLAHHPEVLRAMSEALARCGVSTTASRETTGNTTVHDQLEVELAKFCGQEASILLAEGYSANIAVAQALTRSHGVALIDARAHRSLYSAAAAAGMQVFEYEHRRPESAAWLIGQYADAGVAVFTDGVFAADGAKAPIAALLRVLPRHRATLVVDDCHGLCVLGAQGSGSIELAGIDDPRVVMTTTLAKGLGCYGGAVIGRRALVDTVRDHADVYRRATPVPTPIAMACRSALATIGREPTLLRDLRRNARHLASGLASLGLIPADAGEPDEALVPIFTFVLPGSARMQQVHEAILADGMYAPFIEYPGGPTPRFFRITVCSRHTPDQIERLLGAFAAHAGALAGSR